MPWLHRAGRHSRICPLLIAEDRERRCEIYGRASAETIDQGFRGVFQGPLAIPSTDPCEGSRLYL